MAIDWENFLDPYIQAVGELKIKLRGIRKQYRKQQKHSPIEFVTGRVKPIESIREKMIRRNISEENLAQDMQDIAGLRIMVQFVDDVEEILEVLRQRQDCAWSKSEITFATRNQVATGVTTLWWSIQSTPLMEMKPS